MLTTKQKKDAHKMGDVQKDILEAIHTHHVYYQHGPNTWVWNSPSYTIRTLESLRKRGLVDFVGDESKWVISEVGVEALKHIRAYLFEE